MESTNKNIEGASAIDLIPYIREKIKQASLIAYFDESEEPEKIRNIMLAITERIEAAYLSGYDNGYKAAKLELPDSLK